MTWYKVRYRCGIGCNVDVPIHTNGCSGQTNVAQTLVSDKFKYYNDDAQANDGFDEIVDAGRCGYRYVNEIDGVAHPLEFDPNTSMTFAVMSVVYAVVRLIMRNEALSKYALR